MEATKMRVKNKYFSITPNGRMAQRRLQELKRKKPHLFTVPQKHPRGEWCKHLMENDIFPRKVVRS